jgi:hypothetical protein
MELATILQTQQNVDLAFIPNFKLVIILTNPLIYPNTLGERISVRITLFGLVVENNVMLVIS